MQRPEPVGRSLKPQNTAPTATLPRSRPTRPYLGGSGTGRRSGTPLRRSRCRYGARSTCRSRAFDAGTLRPVQRASAAARLGHAYVSVDHVLLELLEGNPDADGQVALLAVGIRARRRRAPSRAPLVRADADLAQPSLYPAVLSCRGAGSGSVPAGPAPSDLERPTCHHLRLVLYVRMGAAACGSPMHAVTA